MSQRVKPVNPRLSRIPLNEGLVLDCAFWEGAGQVTKELAKGAVGTFSGTPTWVQHGLGRSLNFSGAQNVVFPDSDALSFTLGFSMSAWIRPNNTNPNNTIISKRLTFGATGIPFEVTKDQALISFRVIGNNNQANTGNIIVANQWQHVVCTWSPQGGSKVYVNGILAATATPTGPIVDNSVNVYIGTIPSGGEPFNGLMNDVKVWNRAISYQETIQLFQDPFATYRKPVQDFYNAISATTNKGNFFSFF